jgi:hypothetical protein
VTHKTFKRMAKDASSATFDWIEVRITGKTETKSGTFGSFGRSACAISTKDANLRSGLDSTGRPRLPNAS